MSPCNSHNHPQVPTTVATVMVAYCHQCDAFTLFSQLTTQQDDTRMDTLVWNEVEYGPFDTVDVVLIDALMAVNVLLGSAGRPWDARWDVEEGPEELPPEPAA